MRIILPLFLLLIFNLSILNASYNFRSVSWGMDKKTVKKNEKQLKLVQIGKTLISKKIKFLNEEGVIFYNFKNNKLINAKYIFSNKSRGTHKRLLKEMSEIYGLPEINNTQYIVGYTQHDAFWKHGKTFIHLYYLSSTGLSITFSNQLEFKSSKMQKYADLFKNNNKSDWCKYIRTTNDYDFRKIKWGMTWEEVKKAENDSPDFNSYYKKDKYDQFIMKTLLFNQRATIAYDFSGAKLFRATYKIYINKIDYHKVISKIKQILINKYGKPKISKSNIYYTYYTLRWYNKRSIIIFKYCGNKDTLHMPKITYKARAIFNSSSKSKAADNF